MQHGEVVITEVQGSQLLQRCEGAWFDTLQPVACQVQFLQLVEFRERVACYVAQSAGIRSKSESCLATEQSTIILRRQSTRSYSILIIDP